MSFFSFSEKAIIVLLVVSCSEQEASSIVKTFPQGFLIIIRTPGIRDSRDQLGFVSPQGLASSSNPVPVPQKKMVVSCREMRREASRVAHFQRKLAGTEWQPILWRSAAEI